MCNQDHFIDLHWDWMSICITCLMIFVIELQWTNEWMNECAHTLTNSYMYFIVRTTSVDTIYSFSLPLHSYLLFSHLHTLYIHVCVCVCIYMKLLLSQVYNAFKVNPIKYLGSTFYFEMFRISEDAFGVMWSKSILRRLLFTMKKKKSMLLSKRLM